MKKNAPNTQAFRPSAWFGHVPHCSDELAHRAIFTAPCLPSAPLSRHSPGMQWHWCSCSSFVSACLRALFRAALRPFQPLTTLASPQAMSPLRSQANALPFRGALVSLCALLALVSVASCRCSSSPSLPTGHSILVPTSKQACDNWQVMDNSCRPNPDNGCCTTGWFQFRTVSYWVLIWNVQQYFCLRKSTDCSRVTLTHIICLI